MGRRARCRLQELSVKFSFERELNALPWNYHTKGFAHEHKRIGAAKEPESTPEIRSVGTISSTPFILENVYSLSPERASFVYGINALGVPLMAQINARLIGRVSPQKLLIWGSAVLAIGGITLIGAVIAGVGLVGILPSFFVLITSVGLIAPNATALALGNIRTAGSASALLGVLQIIIGVITVPLIGLGGSKTAVPMALAIAVFGVTTLATVVMISRSGKIDSKAP